MVIDSVTFLCVSVCSVRPLTFESLDVETSFLIHSRRYVFKISRSWSNIEVMGQGQGRMSITRYTCAGGLLLTERQCYGFCLYSYNLSQFLVLCIVVDKFMVKWSLCIYCSVEHCHVQVYFGTQHAKMYLDSDLLGINCVTGMSCLFRKDVLEDAGGFSYLGKFLAEDYYLGKLFIDRYLHLLNA